MVQVGKHIITSFRSFLIYSHSQFHVPPPAAYRNPCQNAYTSSSIHYVSEPFKEMRTTESVYAIH